MIGLISLVLIGLWGFISYKLAAFIVRKLKSDVTKYIAKIVLILFLFFVPIIDEIIGGFQFRSLCRDAAILVVDEQQAQGKTVIYERSQDVYINSYFVPVIESNNIYKDTSTGQVLVSWNVFRAQGGWLARKLNVLSSTKPYFFNGVCISPKWKKTIFSDLNITESNE